MLVFDLDCARFRSCCSNSLVAGRRAKRFRAGRVVTVGFIGPKVHFSGDLVDPNTTGVLVRCSHDLEPGTRGRLGIELGEETIRILAVVRRVLPGIGITFEFIKMTLCDRE